MSKFLEPATLREIANKAIVPEYEQKALDELACKLLEAAKKGLCTSTCTVAIKSNRADMRAVAISFEGNALRILKNLGYECRLTYNFTNDGVKFLFEIEW